MIVMSRADRLYEVLRHIRPVHQYSARAVEQSLADRELTMAMRAVVEQLHERGPQPVPGIARSLWLSRQAVQRLVDQARAAGYVEQRPNPAHRRSPLIALTDHGRQTFDQLHAEELERLEGLAAEVDPDDIEACLRVLAHLTRSLRSSADPEQPDAGWTVPGPRPGEEVR